MIVSYYKSHVYPFSHFLIATDYVIIYLEKKKKCLMIDRDNRKKYNKHWYPKKTKGKTKTLNVLICLVVLSSNFLFTRIQQNY